MPRLSFSSLRVRLILLVLIGVIPALGLIIYSSFDHRRHAAEEVKMNALRFTSMAGGNVERFIEGTHQMLNTLAYMSIVRERNSAVCNQLFAALLKQHPHYNNIGATDAAGNVFASAVPYKRPINFADRLWFRRAVETRNFAVGEFIVGRITGKHTLVFSYPVFDQRGVLLGTVYAATDLVWLNQAIKDISLPADSSVTVLDRRGTIITRYPDPEKWAGKTLPEASVIKMILERKEGITETVGIDGVTRLYVFTPLHGMAENGIYLGIGLSKASAFAEINRDLVRNLIWLGLVTLFALAAAWVGGDAFILRKVKMLVEATKRLRNGDLTARTKLPHQNGEISQLAYTFDEMAEALEQRALVAQQAEEALRQSEARYRQLFENMLHGFAYCRLLFENGQPQDFIYLEVNSAFEKLTGLKNVVGKKVTEIIPGIRDSYPELFKIYGRVSLTGQPERFELYMEQIAAWLSISVYSTEKECFIAVFDNITERKQAEAAREKLSKEMQLLLESTDEGIYGIDMNGNCTFINRAAVKTLGYEDKPVLGMNMHDLVHHRYPDGTPYPADKCPIFRAFRLGQGCRVDNEVYWRQDGSSFPAEYSSYPIIDEGVIKGAVVTFTDITERKRLEAQLLQAQKIEAIGTLAGGVAHDFNNLLTAITINLELAKSKLEKGQAVEPHLEEIKNVSNSAAKLTQQLLAFSRRQILQLVPLNLNDVIASLSKMLSRLIGEYIELDLRLASGLGIVKADPGQIEQVIMNLVVNARDAMPTGGKLTLATQNIEVDAAYVDNHPWVEKGNYVLLEVSDTGCGMDKATLARIFEPFFTTKEVSKGTGLGLSTVFGIVKQHQGYLNVYSEPGQGTIFKIYLPRMEKKVVEEEIKEVPRKMEGGKETILLAEDEESLREAIKNILGMFGYTVLLAEDGQAAVEIYQREGKKIDLVILDAVMPKMGGVEVAEWINKINPSQKVLFSSGYTAEGIHEKFVIPDKMHFIQKPYTAKDLARKVREVLEKE